MLGARSQSGRSSLSAVIGLVVCLSLFAVALGYVVSSARLVSETYERSEMRTLAKVISNDLIMNPGFGNHTGLAVYEYGARRVLDHEIDRTKVARLNSTLQKNPESLKSGWNIGYDFGIEIVNLDSGETLAYHKPAKKFGTKISVTRLALMGDEHVRLRFWLFA